MIGALLAVVAACGDGTGPGGLSGSLSFSYSGVTSGTFSASGSVGVLDPFGSTWAAGVRDETNQSLSVAANVARPSDRSDDAVIAFPQLTPGTVTIANGAGIAITFGMTQSGTATWACDVTSGSVTVTTLSGTRARGTFSGTGTCFNDSGASGAFTVTNGTFDVPAVSGA